MRSALARAAELRSPLASYSLARPLLVGDASMSIALPAQPSHQAAVDDEAARRRLMFALGQAREVLAWDEIEEVVQEARDATGES